MSKTKKQKIQDSLREKRVISLDSAMESEFGIETITKVDELTGRLTTARKDGIDFTEDHVRFMTVFMMGYNSASNIVGLFRE